MGFAPWDLNRRSYMPPMHPMATDPEVPCSEKLRVLSDRTRLEVVKSLLRGSALAGELGADLEVEQSLLSHHLRVLREAGLVISSREGAAKRYALAEGVRVGERSVSLGCCELSFAADA